MIVGDRDYVRLDDLSPMGSRDDYRREAVAVTLFAIFDQHALGRPHQVLKPDPATLKGSFAKSCSSPPLHLHARLEPA